MEIVKDAIKNLIQQRQNVCPVCDAHELDCKILPLEQLPVDAMNFQLRADLSPRKHDLHLTSHYSQDPSSSTGTTLRGAQESMASATTETH